MLLKTMCAGLAAAFFAAVPALAETSHAGGTATVGPITVEDAYARASTPTSPSGAAFMLIRNAGTEDDRLIAAASDAAQRVELHTHVENAEGVMRMVEVKDGFPVPAGGAHALQRGGDHVMFMGLTAPMIDGETVTVTLTFERAGEVTIEIPVDLQRMPAMHHGGHGSHGADG